jgi:hypothetical protein
MSVAGGPVSAFASIRKPGVRLLGAMLVWSLAQSVPAADDAQFKYIGAQTCGQSTCHSAGEPWFNSAVRQDEFLIWRDHDSHSGAYDALKSENARRIAANLGLGDPTGEGTCLDCHANNVPVARRGRDFDISNGVTCESCHGGAEQWLSTHISGATFPGDNYEAGMYPTADPAARARVCMACHVGDEQRAVTHRLIAAGHPRTPFELDTYTVAQPAHYRIDADYRARKSVAGGAAVWATGQVYAASMMLDRLAALTHDQYLFTEYSLLDCQGCHRVVDPSQASIRTDATPRINDANLVMVEVIARHVDPGLGSRIGQQIDALRAAVSKSMDATRDATVALRQSVKALSGRAAIQGLDHRDARQLMSSVLKRTQSGGINDYLTVEQTILSLATLIDAQYRAGALQGERYSAMKRELDRCYDAARDKQSVAWNVVRSAFANMQKILSTS